ncbi:hypothetical protein [Streptomyces tubercidicus]
MTSDGWGTYLILCMRKGVELLFLRAQIIQNAHPLSGSFQTEEIERWLAKMGTMGTTFHTQIAESATVFEKVAGLGAQLHELATEKEESWTFPCARKTRCVRDLLNVHGLSGGPHDIGTLKVESFLDFLDKALIVKGACSI